jgi:hypothetical protein
MHWRLFSPVVPRSEHPDLRGFADVPERRRRGSALSGGVSLMTIGALRLYSFDRAGQRDPGRRGGATAQDNPERY